MRFLPGRILQSTLAIFLVSIMTITAPALAASTGIVDRPVFFDPSNFLNVQQCLINTPCLEDARAYYKAPQNVGKNEKNDDLFFSNPDNVNSDKDAARIYFSKKANVAKIQKSNPKAADAYFGNTDNMQNLDPKNLEGADMYFSTRGNMERFHEAGIEYLKKKYGAGLDIKMEKDIGVVYDSDKELIVVNGNSMDLKSFKDTTHKVSLNKGGEFVIDGNRYKGFAKISRLGSGEFAIDDMIAKPSGEGNKFTPKRLDINDGTIVKSSKTSKGYPEWQVTSKQKGLAVFLDETKATKLPYPAVSVTKGGVLANKMAIADLQSGPIMGDAKSGTLYQKRPIDETVLKEFVSDPSFHKGSGYHLGVQSSTATSEGGIQRIDLNPLSERALSGMRYTEGKNILRGTDVEEVQKMLRRIGIKDGEGNTGDLVDADGAFGPATKQAIKNFQAANGMKDPTGALDAKTLQELYDQNKEMYIGSMDGFEKGTMVANPSRYSSGSQNIEGWWPVPSQTPMNNFGRGGYNTRSSFHSGIDLEAGINTPVRSMGNGIVTFAGWQYVHGWGMEVYYPDMTYIDDNGRLRKGATIRYSHLNGIPVIDQSTGQILPSVDTNQEEKAPGSGKKINSGLPQLTTGMTVSDGQVVAYAGHSGGRNPKAGCGVPHVHMEVKPGAREISSGTKIANQIYDPSARMNPKTFMKWTLKAQSPRTVAAD